MGAQSKGCGTCKKRKVKCDETHPQCTRCRKANIECTGYVQRLRFVDEKSRIRRSMAVSHAQSLESSGMTESSDSKFHSGQTRQSQTLSPTPCLTNTLLLTAFKDDIFISYLFSKLFEEEYEYQVSAEGETRCGLPTDWVSELVKTPQKPRHKSWDALAAIVFGQAHNSYDVITDALKLYGQALSELRNELSDPDDRRTESTLASITALYRYEILVSKTEKGWMFHADGLGWLLKWRGPWKQKSCTSKSIFLEHRIMLVARSIISRQSTFLHDPIWKTVPWEDDPTSKLSVDYLVDIATDIAEYVAQIKTYENSKVNQDITYSQLRTQVVTSLEELNTWWRKWEAEYGELASEVTAHKSTSEPLFPTLLEYDTLWTAFTVCIYDAIRILLLQLWHILQLRPSLIQTTDQAVILDTPNRTALLGITSDTKGLASEILRTLGYGYRKSRRFICSFSFLFIQDVAYGCFDQGSKEAIWVAEHGWAEPTKFDDIENANLLRRLLPLGRIKAGDVRLDTSSRAAPVL